MSFAKQLLTAGAAAAVLSTPAIAQAPIDYSNHWQPTSDLFGNGVILPDIVAFTFTGFVPAPAGLGDAIRRCYGTDTTQAGRNQSAGNVEGTWMRLVQGYGAGASTQQAQAGIVSVQMGSDSSLGGDACFSPWFPTTGNTGGHAVAAATIFGGWGAAGTPVPTFWIVVAQWAGSTTSNFHGVTGPTTIGNAGGNPLLVNTIFEIQGPLNAGDRQYYIATTSELTGANGGGVTNGNTTWGSALFGAGPATTGAIAHTRIFGFDDPAFGGSGFLTGGVLSLGASPGTTEVIAASAFNTPGLWGINDGNEGAGGNDWRISTDPLSVVDVRCHDNLSGAQTHSTGTAASDPCIVFNQPIFLWSATPALGMPQLPMSWDDLGGILPAQPGSIILGAQATSREGPQTVAANFDAVSQLVLTFSGLTLGTAFADSTDFFLDGGGTAIFFEGLTVNMSEGVAHFSGGASPLTATANPNLAGAKLGIAGIGIQVNACTGFVGVSEMTNSLEINLQ
jgi:hypothetical protein